MPRKGQRKAKKALGNPSDPEGMGRLALQFFAWMRTRNYAERTIGNREMYLGYFIDWCAERGLQRPGEITKPILERYQRYLYHYRKEDGRPLSFRSQHTRLLPVRAYFKWLARNNHILYNPASELELPKLEHRLPKHVLSANEAEQVLSQPDTSEPLGIRDRAILETFYSTGMRRMELVNLVLYDVDPDRGTVVIRQGKGRKDRMVPIGARALKWVQKYIDEVRPQLTLEPDGGTLFLSNLGEGFCPSRMTQMVRRYVQAADGGKSGSCHLFRHTMATLMLENGADIRFIQAMLGHVSLETTQIYTRVGIRKLKEIHEMAHPARVGRTVGAESTPESTEDALFASLAAEAVEETDEEATDIA